MIKKNMERMDVGKCSVSLPLFTAQGSHRVVPMDRRYGNIVHCFHPVSPHVGDCRTVMID